MTNAAAIALGDGVAMISRICGIEWDYSCMWLPCLKNLDAVPSL